MTDMGLYEKIEETAAFLKSKGANTPAAGIILGTGLGALVKDIEDQTVISYRDIPHFPVSTVESHSGNLIFGRLAGKNVMAMQGRFHLYEGYTMEQITFPVRVMKALGCSTLLVSNACGGLNTAYAKGDIMIITDHINLLGANPLIGPNDDRLGCRFPDMSAPYTRSLVEKAAAAASDQGITVKQGVYACMSGPSLETAAEYRFLQIIKADVIGMSTVPEVIVAVHAGLQVLGLSVVTDLCFPESLVPADISEIIAVAGEAEPKLIAIMKRTLETLDA